ncbi:hypothetical protein U9M48_039274 [Paspalum notatum var. saurae]|uniref:Uncharacterized protein n=1 Tax=Paspalum notatum var. saurae TaxID=547442 RepID=A0AAQ3UPY5_PASNO
MAGERRVEGSRCPDRVGSGGWRGAGVPGCWRWLLCGAWRGAGRPPAWTLPPWGTQRGIVRQPDWRRPPWDAPRAWSAPAAPRPFPAPLFAAVVLHRRDPGSCRRLRSSTAKELDGRNKRLIQDRNRWQRNFREDYEGIGNQQRQGGEQGKRPSQVKLNAQFISE